MDKIKKEEILGYYVELSHNSLDQNYILQSKNFKTIEEANNFVKNFDFVDDELCVNLMALVGKSDDEYDVHLIGYFQETPIDGLQLGLLENCCHLWEE